MTHGSVFAAHFLYISDVQRCKNIDTLFQDKKAGVEQDRRQGGSEVWDAEKR